jgi:hypothetical protein
MTHDEMIAVIAHHRDGGKLEWSHIRENQWRHCGKPCWDFSSCDYRPKPEPMVIFAEVSKLTGVVMRASTDSLLHQYDNTTIKKFIECND